MRKEQVVTGQDFPEHQLRVGVSAAFKKQTCKFERLADGDGAISDQHSLELGSIRAVVIMHGPHTLILWSVLTGGSGGDGANATTRANQNCQNQNRGERESTDHAVFESWPELRVGLS